MMAFKALGYSMNTSDPDEINAAYEWLLQMNDTMSPVYVTDEVIDGMMNGYKDLAVVYSGDATVILDENEDMSFYMPEQGTNIWCDAMVIPANAENPLLAHEFINYMLTYEAAFDNTETVGYTSPNAEVFEEMTSSEDLYAENAAYLPRSGYEKDEDPNAEDITTGAKNGLKLADLRGVDYNDSKWDDLLDETVSYTHLTLPTKA